MRRALAEDIGTGDVTAALSAAGTRARAELIAREDAVLCGTAWFDASFRELDANVLIDWAASDADRVTAGAVVCRLQGDARAILTAERTALNFLQTLSGTATMAARFVAAVSGTGATILDTRKTIPGLRAAQKYAVRCGGASNHRIGLFDAVLIKENHIAAVGSIEGAIASARAAVGDRLVEVEVETMDQLEAALGSAADRIMLDDFSLDDMRAAVEIRNRRGSRQKLEASGGVSLESVGSVAATGVDFISVGSMTKSVRAVDFSLRVVETIA